jgi:hypothetical protein
MAQTEEQLTEQLKASRATSKPSTSRSPAIRPRALTYVAWISRGRAQ